MRFFSVKNFERFQHYKDRSPPWIKLYNELLDDYAFSALPDASKFHLVAIWLLASRSDNRIPYDPVWVAARINARNRVDLDAMVKAGFLLIIPDATDDVAERKQDASKTLDQRRGEGETEQSRGEGDVCALAVGLWNDLARDAGLPSVQVLSDERRAALRKRLTDCGGLDGWSAALTKVRDSPFLCGKNKDGWKADFDFLLRKSKFIKLMEGGYDNTPGGGFTNGFAQLATQGGV